MAAVEVTFNGVLYDKQWRTARPVVFVGEAYLTGLSVGGGPIIPPPSEQPPLGIWGPGDPRPNPPIYWPGFPVNPPGGVFPPQPIEPPPDPGIVKPPPPEGGWGWSPEYGWGYFPGTGGAGPKK